MLDDSLFNRNTTNEMRFEALSTEIFDCSNSVTPRIKAKSQLSFQSHKMTNNQCHVAQVENVTMADKILKLYLRKIRTKQKLNIYVHNKCL